MSLAVQECLSIEKPETTMKPISTVLLRLLHQLLSLCISHSVSADYKKEHTEARLSFGFLLLNFLDAVKEGDGERLMRLYKVALLIFKTYGHSQYAYSTLLLTVQINATLPLGWLIV